MGAPEILTHLLAALVGGFFGAMANDLLRHRKTPHQRTGP